MTTPAPVFTPGEPIRPADLDVVAAQVRRDDRAVILRRYRSQNTATTIAPRIRETQTTCRTPDGRALKITSRKVDGVVGVFAYLTDEHLRDLVDHYDYSGGARG